MAKVPKPIPKWLPEVGAMVPVNLPHEIIRAQVTKHVGPDTIQVKLVHHPMGKTHNYRLNQLVELHRVDNPPAGYRWETAD